MVVAIDGKVTNNGIRFMQQDPGHFVNGYIDYMVKWIYICTSYRVQATLHVAFVLIILATHMALEEEKKAWDCKLFICDSGEQFSQVLT